MLSRSSYCLDLDLKAIPNTAFLAIVWTIWFSIEKKPLLYLQITHIYVQLCNSQASIEPVGALLGQSVDLLMLKSFACVQTFRCAEVSNSAGYKVLISVS